MYVYIQKNKSPESVRLSSSSSSSSETNPPSQQQHLTPVSERFLMRGIIATVCSVTSAICSPSAKNNKNYSTFKYNKTGDSDSVYMIFLKFN